MSYDDKTRTILLDQEPEFLLDLGEMMVNTLRAIAASPESTERIRQDWATIETWLNCSGRLLNEADSNRIRAAFRAYYICGNPPSQKARPVFDLAKKQIGSANWRNCPRQIRDVFDRMSATDSEISAERARQLRERRPGGFDPKKHERNMAALNAGILKEKRARRIEANKRENTQGSAVLGLFSDDAEQERPNWWQRLITGRRPTGSDSKSRMDQVYEEFSEGMRQQAGNWWQRQTKTVRAWLFTSAVWALVVFLFVWVFDPFYADGIADLDDEDILQMLFIMAIPLLGGAIKFAYDKLVK